MELWKFLVVVLKDTQLLSGLPLSVETSDAMALAGGVSDPVPTSSSSISHLRYLLS